GVFYAALQRAAIVVERVWIVIGIERPICKPFFGDHGKGGRFPQRAAHARRITTVVDVDPHLTSFLPSVPEAEPSDAIAGVAAELDHFAHAIAGRVVHPPSLGAFRRNAELQTGLSQVAPLLT